MGAVYTRRIRVSMLVFYHVHNAAVDQIEVVRRGNAPRVEGGHEADNPAEAEHEQVEESHRRRTFVKSGPLNWSTNAADKLSICGNSFPLYLTAPFGRFHNPPAAWRSS